MKIQVLPFTEIQKLDDKELYKYCRLIGQNARRWKRLFVAMLPEVARRRLHKKYGFYSIHEFAAKLGGVSHNVVDEAFRIEGKLKDKPRLKALIPRVGLSKLRVVANVAEKRTDEFWAEKVENMSKNTLSVYVQEIKKAEKNKFPGEFPEKAIGDSRLIEGENESSTTNVHFSDFDNVSRKYFGFKIDPSVEVKFKLFQRWLEKQRKEAVEFNEVLRSLIEIAEIHSSFGKTI